MFTFINFKVIKNILISITKLSIAFYLLKNLLINYFKLMNFIKNYLK